MVLGQQISALSLPVVLSTDQTSIPITNQTLGTHSNLWSNSAPLLDTASNAIDCQYITDHYLTLGIYIVALAITGVSMMTMLLYFGPGGGRFDILATTIRAQYLDRPVLLNIFNFCNYCLKRDAFAFIFAVFAVLGLGRYIPEFLIVGLVVWNLAILLNARSILRLKSAISEI